MYVSRKHEEKSPLTSYLMLSIGLHAFILILFLWVVPDIEIYQRKITVTMNLGSAVPTAPTLPVPNEVPVPPKTTPQPPQPKEKAKPPAPKPIESKPVENKITPKPTPAPAPTPVPVPVKQTEPAPVPKPITPEPQKPEEKKTETLPEAKPVQEQIKTTPTPPKEEEVLANELENLLAQKQDTKTVHSDFLDDASWTGSPRKTIIFPKITEKIPAEYKARGYGYSVTASITFSPQGWVSSVELLKSSGDPVIDNVFRNELRKIRIEESDKNAYDTVVKTFTISVK
ncbi:MAG: hypothetical protein ACRCS8_00775 [Brevinema sp.]